MKEKISRIIDSLRYYIVADPFDNSITLSKRLFERIMRDAKKGGEAAVFAFRIPECDAYAFTLKRNVKQDALCCSIQYNEKHKCVGFEMLCPSVGRMLYDYGLPAQKSVKLSVLVCKVNGITYYKIGRPDEKLIRKQLEA